jgi:hypothetical protein
LCGVPAWRELAKLRAEITGKDELIEVRKPDASGLLVIEHHGDNPMVWKRRYRTRWDFGRQTTRLSAAQA